MSTGTDSKVDSAPISILGRLFWVPIRSLAKHHCTHIARHILSLNESDRYLRFGYPATDEQVQRYVESIDVKQDEVFGVFNRNLELIAMAHLAYCRHQPEPKHQRLPSSVSR